MEPTISTTMTGCMNITDPHDPKLFDARMEFFAESPLEFRFVFMDPAGDARWLVGRQLVVDGLDAVLLTGLGDYKSRSTAKRYIIMLKGDGGYWALRSLPKAQVQFVVNEAEHVCPVETAEVDMDAELAALLGGAE
jgi:hypothetical protein